MSKMDFAIALRAMQQGKKVRRATWEEGQFVMISNGEFIDGNASYVCLCGTDDLLANDWGFYDGD